MKMRGNLKHDVPAKLRAIGNQFSPDFIELKDVLPTVPVATGPLKAIVRLVAAEPPERRWRYFIVLPNMPYLDAEEVVQLATAAGWPIKGLRQAA